MTICTLSNMLIAHGREYLVAPLLACLVVVFFVRSVAFSRVFTLSVTFIFGTVAHAMFASVTSSGSRSTSKLRSTARFTLPVLSISDSVLISQRGCTFGSVCRFTHRSCWDSICISSCSFLRGFTCLVAVFSGRELSRVCFLARSLAFACAHVFVARFEQVGDPCLLAYSTTC